MTFDDEDVTLLEQHRGDHDGPYWERSPANLIISCVQRSLVCMQLSHLFATIRFHTHAVDIALGSMNQSCMQTWLILAPPIQWSGGRGGQGSHRKRCGARQIMSFLKCELLNFGIFESLMLNIRQTCSIYNIRHSLPDCILHDFSWHHHWTLQGTAPCHSLKIQLRKNTKSKIIGIDSGAMLSFFSWKERCLDGQDSLQEK